MKMKEKQRLESAFQEIYDLFIKDPDKYNNQIWTFVYNACSAAVKTYYVGKRVSEDYLEDKCMDATTYLYGRIKGKGFRPESLATCAYWAAKMVILKYSKEEQNYKFTDLEAFTGMPLENIIEKTEEEIINELKANEEEY